MNTDKLHFAEGGEALPPGKRKAALRAYMKRRRGENENRDAKEALLVENFFKAGLGEKANFFVYLSFSSEAPTDKLIESLLARGKSVYCPRVEGREMAAALFSDDFALSPYGIREPVEKAYTGGLDIAVLPLLAVDERGNRLGYGGGYYDRFLRARPEILRVAYCFDFQLVREVPREAWDERADLIVTDKRIVDTKRKV